MESASEILPVTLPMAAILVTTLIMISMPVALSWSSAPAGPAAVAGTYSFYVEQLATAGQIAYGGISDTAAAGSGSLNVVLADGTVFEG
eukprot:gene42184-56029_t